MKEQLVDSDVDKLFIRSLKVIPNAYTHLATYLSAKLKINTMQQHQSSAQHHNHNQQQQRQPQEMLFDGNSVPSSRENYITSVLNSEQAVKFSSDATIRFDLERLKLSGRFSDIKECLFNIDSSASLGASAHLLTFITCLLLCSWIVFVQRIF